MNFGFDTASVRCLVLNIVTLSCLMAEGNAMDLERRSKHRKDYAYIRQSDARAVSNIKYSQGASLPTLVFSPLRCSIMAALDTVPEEILLSIARNIGGKWLGARVEHLLL
jgi:hypothetical protein